MATTYRVNGRPATKAQYDQHSFLHFGGPDPSIKKDALALVLAGPPAVELPPGPSKFIEATSGNSIENILSSFRTNEGYAHPNRYEVSIFPPDGGRSWPESNLISQVRSDAREISLRCESVTLPGRNLSSTPDTNMHGPVKEVVNNVNYADSIPMVFQASADLRERVFFEKWQYTAFNPVTWNVGYYNDYIGEVDIYLLNKNNQRKYALKLMECFPKSIAQTDLSYASNNEIIKLTIDMNFRYWITLDINQITSKETVAIQGGSLGAFAQHSGHNHGPHANLFLHNIPASVGAFGQDR